MADTSITIPTSSTVYIQTEFGPTAQATHFAYWITGDGRGPYTITNTAVELYIPFTMTQTATVTPQALVDLLNGAPSLVANLPAPTTAATMYYGPPNANTVSPLVVQPSITTSFGSSIILYFPVTTKLPAFIRAGTLFDALSITPTASGPGTSTTTTQFQTSQSTTSGSTTFEPSRTPVSVTSTIASGTSSIMPNHHANGTSIGGILGGTIAGLVVGLGLGVLVTWYCLAKRRSGRKTAPSGSETAARQSTHLHAKHERELMTGA